MNPWTIIGWIALAILLAPIIAIAVFIATDPQFQLMLEGIL